MLAPSTFRFKVTFKRDHNFTTNLSVDRSTLVTRLRSAPILVDLAWTVNIQVRFYIVMY